MKFVKQFTLLLCLFCSAKLCLAEGSKDLMADTSSRSALCTNNGFFASYNSVTQSVQRLNIHIANTNEIIYLGFSLGYSTGTSQILGEGSTSTPEYFFRILDPAGSIVFGPQGINSTNAIPAGMAGFNQIKAGPAAIAGSAGYVGFSYIPPGVGDYFIEFNKTATGFSTSQCSFDYWDITVANRAGPTPVPISGRIWSKQWGFYSKDYVGGGAYSGVFKGAFYSYTPDGFVEKVNFNNADFRSGSFGMGMNDNGPGNTGNYCEDRKSLFNQNVVGSQYKLFLNNPDSLEYPTGNSIFPTLSVTDPEMDCGGTVLVINYNLSRAGSVQMILDFDSNGIYNYNTRDVVIAKKSAAGNQSIVWDMKDGQGNAVDTLTLLKIRLLTEYQLGVHHISFEDIELMSNGFTVEQVRPVFRSGLEEKFYWDDSNIFSSAGLKVPFKTGPQPNTVELDGAPVRKWDNFIDNTTIGFGNKNSINTWWNVYKLNKANRITNAPCRTLSVKLQDLMVRKSGEDAIISWNANSEEFIQKYVVEKSTNATVFTAVSEQLPQRSASISSYTFSDAVAGKGLIYYRLKIYNLQNEATYSSVKTVLMGSETAKLSLSPHPVNSKLIIKLPGDATGSVAICQFINSAGQLVMTISKQVSGRLIQIENLDISAGVYYLKVIAGGKVYTQSMLKN